MYVNTIFFILEGTLRYQYSRYLNLIYLISLLLIKKTLKPLLKKGHLLIDILYALFTINIPTATK